MENIDQLLDKLATQLSGTNALIQVLIGDECYVRKVGDLNQIANNPHRVEPATDKPFLPWMLQQIDRSHIARGTYANPKSTYDVLSDFRPDMTFGSLDYQFLLDFEAYLRERHYAVNTIAKFMKILRRYVNIAIDLELMNKYPFRKYHIRLEATHKNSLTERELRKVERNVDSLPENEQRVARGFLFSVYSGLRFSDVSRVTRQHIKKINSNQWLVMKMQKTDREVRVPLSRMFGGKAIDLIGKARNATGRLFPMPNNARTNILLGRALRRLGIRKHCSFHCARVSSATLMLMRGGNLTTIQHILGHNDIKTTQVYAKVTDGTLLRDVGRIFR